MCKLAATSLALALVLWTAHALAAQRPRTPQALIEDHAEAAKAFGGERAASLLAGAQLDALVEILADRRGLVFDYYRMVLSRLEEHGTEETLPALERLLNSDVRDKRQDGLRYVIWMFRDDATRAWYRVKSRDLTDAEKAVLLLAVLFPGKCEVLASPHAIPVEEYAKYVPLRRQKLFAFLADGEVEMRGDAWPRLWYVWGESTLGKVLASTPTLSPPRNWRTSFCRRGERMDTSHT